VKAVLESFPTLSDNSKLKSIDFSWFSTTYSEILQKYIPGSKRVFFVFSAEQFETLFRTEPSFAELFSLFRQVKEGGVACGIHADYLMLSFAATGGERHVAIICGADPLFLQKVSVDWLLDTKGTVEREFLLLKQARVDSQTGLLNIANLYSLLDRYGATEGLYLMLLELVPKRTSFQHVLRYSHKCAALLLDFVKAGSMVHYLGQATFALVLQQNSAKEQPELESALVSYLKRAGCHRVHIGSSFSKAGSDNEKSFPQGRKLLDEAWTALRHAVRRGPFSFCDFSQLAHPEKHPLAPPDRSLVRRLNRLWAKSKRFCLVHFCSDTAECPASSVVPSRIHQGVVITDGADVFLYLDGASSKEALKLAKEIIQGVSNPDENIHISAGVSSYPYSDFRKTEMVFNCRKALLHAAFYGPSSTAVFDAVTLNISGDIFFSDGDLTRAVKEYQRGLKCDNQNVNLHNSLGVTWAMMNKLSPALQSFITALALDDCNFMALYNLGLGEQARNRQVEALAYMEKALQYYSEEEGGPELVNDLVLQLGILCCENGRYQDALSYLIPWQSKNSQDHSAGRVHYYLGKAHHALGDNRQAMTDLQRALRFDEFDDRAMNLLGRVYLDENEGDQIALSLCRKSVELEPANRSYMLNLAEVLLQCGLFHEARENLHRCLRSRDCKVEAQLLLGQSYTSEGQHKRARKWYEKVVEQETCHPTLKAAAKKKLAENLARK
jgi:tetratricopeptide (TPR) repeat protein